MYRRDFLKSTGAAVTSASMGMAGLDALLLPGRGLAVPVDALSTKLDVAFKKKLASAAHGVVAERTCGSVVTVCF
jgi:hypothetical protein